MPTIKKKIDLYVTKDTLSPLFHHKMTKKILVWFRNDLRLHDNEVLVEAILKSDLILPVYIFDPRSFGETDFGTLKTGNVRAEFLLESVLALRNALIQIGGNLIIKIGKPEEIIPNLVAEYGIGEVYHHREVAKEETELSGLLENELWKQKINLRHFIGHTLYNKADLPFPIKDIPDTFNQFRKKVERDSIIKPCLVSPTSVEVVDVRDWGELPTLEDFGLAKQQRDNRAPFEFSGGEQSGLFLLEKTIATIKQAALSKTLIIDSILSAWLAMGCLSPRQVYWELKSLENLPNAKSIFNHIQLGLLWRDYFRFMFKKHGYKFYEPDGFGKQPQLGDQNDKSTFANWKNGQTGFAVVDAVMTELNTTGYISNLARQTTSHFFISNVDASWVYGAAYFEEKLIDYNPSSNWGNWANMAGVGADQKNKPTFNFEKNLKNLDPKGNYALTWAS